MEETIHFYHINDIHSHFEHWQRIQHFITDRKLLHNSVGEEVLILDIGDHADRSHPYTEALLGKGNVDLLNQLGCQYATIGNNEGITFPYDTLNHLYDEANFKVLVSNLYDKNGERPSWTLPYSIHTTQKGSRIALIGATASFRLFYQTLGWQITEPLEEIQRVVNEVKEHSDIIVLLSHLGLEYDEQLADLIPDIHLILGAHTHHILHEGKMVNKTLLCGAGKAGRYVGHVEMTIKVSNEAPTSVARVYNMNEQEPIEKEVEFEKALYQVGKENLRETVCELSSPLAVDWFEESPLPQLLCHALRDWCKADCAFLNAGLLMEGLEAGPVTLYDLHRICPHPINPCVVKLSGQELKEILLQSMDEEWPHMQVKGFGFRGNILGKMIYSNIKIVSHHEIYIGDEKLDSKKVYSLAIPDMFTFGFFFPHIKRTEKKTYYLPEFMRDVLADKLTTINS